MLKLGTCGILRISLPLIPYACMCFTPLFYNMSVIAIVYTGYEAYLKDYHGLLQLLTRRTVAL